MFSFLTRRKTEPVIKPPRVIFSTVDWSKIRPSTGDHANDKILGELLRGSQ